MEKRVFKKVIVTILTIAMLLPAFMQVDFEAYAATGYDRGYAGGRYGNSSSTVYAYGLDVSSWQGYNLNFYALKNAGYDYVILRCGTTYGKDSCFETNYAKAKAAGMDVGVYYYSYALNSSQALNDAYNCLNWIGGKTFEYPIYFDYEDPSQDYLSNTTAQNICLTFMDTLANRGYLVGMYTGLYKSMSLPTNAICSKYEFWVAAYYYDGLYRATRGGTTFAHISGMYQYTSTNYVNGVGPLDTNVCYKDYPSIVKTYGFNGYAPTVNNGGSSSGTSTGTSSSAAVDTNQLLQKGSTGTQVGYLQSNLKGLGYSVNVDNSYGNETYNAVVQYQKDNSLLVDGIAGPETLTSIVGKAKKVQKDLFDLCYYDGALTGVLNGDSVNAIKKFQNINGLSQTGVANVNTLKMIATAVQRHDELYYPRCTSGYTSLYPAFQSLGISCDWELHKKIAAANGITGFTGTAAQNTQLLNLLKKGLLVKPEAAVKYFPACASSYTSLYPAFQSLGISCDWEYHKKIAATNGIENFVGTAEQNTQLLNLLKQGRLIRPSEAVVEYFPSCGSSYTSLYPALESVGVNCDWELHKKIAAVNGITNFTGTVAQNTQLLNLLKQGKLIKPYASEYFGKCASSYTSLYPAFQSLGISCDWEYHKRIAAINGIKNFTGTAAQNTQLLNLLKQGKLIKPIG